MSSEDYLTSLGIFYDEKIKFLSKKDNLLKCKDCDLDKQFIEEHDKITLTCGKTDKTNCGIQITIEFPLYIDHEKEISKIKEELEKDINWEVINNYIDVDGEVKKQKDKKKILNEQINMIKKKVKVLSFENRKKTIEDYYNKRIERTDKCNEIIVKLKDVSLTSDQKKSLREDYVNHIKSLNEEYIEINTIIEKINPHIMKDDSEPVVKIHNKQYEKVNKVKKKKKFKVNDEVVFMQDKKEISGVVTKIIRKKYRIVDEDDEVYLIEEDELKLKEDKSKEDELKKEKPKKDELKEDNEISYFSRSKDYKWLSSFNKANAFEYNGKIYPTVEHAFQAQKIDLDDPKKDEYQDKFTDEKLAPNEAKKMGGKGYFKSNNYSFRAKDWDKVKLSIMKDIVSEYYKSNPDMAKKLVETGDKKLVHKGFGIDGFWGVTKKENNNHHGKILMEMREELKDPKFYEPEPQIEESDDLISPKTPSDPPPFWEGDDPRDKDDDDKNDGMFVPKSIKELKEGLKVIWTDEDGNELNGYINVIDKRMKKNVNIVIYDDQGGEMQLKVPLSDIKIIK